MDFSDVDSTSSDVGSELLEVENKDTDFGDGDGVNEFDETYNEMNSGNESLEYSEGSEGTDSFDFDENKSGETMDTTVADELSDFDDLATSEGVENAQTDVNSDGVLNQSDMTTDENVDDALADFDDDSDAKPEDNSKVESSVEDEFSRTGDTIEEGDDDDYQNGETDDVNDESQSEVDEDSINAEETQKILGNNDDSDGIHETEPTGNESNEAEGSESASGEVNDSRGVESTEESVDNVFDSVEDSIDSENEAENMEYDPKDANDATQTETTEENADNVLDNDVVDSENSIDEAKNTDALSNDATDGNNDIVSTEDVNQSKVDDQLTVNEGTDSGSDAKKTAIFENVSYYQGQNDLGALGTCGSTSIANSLNRITETSDYTENAVLNSAINDNLCYKSDNPYSCGGTTTNDVVNVVDNVKSPESNIHTEVYDYDKALSVDDLESRLDDPRTVAMVGVDSATLWDQKGDVASSGLFQHTDSPSDHWITVDSPIRDEAGNLLGFNVIDSGGGASEVYCEKFETMYMGDANHSVPDPAAVLISNSGDEVNLFSTSERVEKNSNYKDSAMESDGGDSPNEVSAYDEFKSLSADEQVEMFSDMSSGEIYDLVKNSSESWPVDGYDRITPENAKDFIKLNVNDRCEISFNLDWPKYGGYDPETISSISNLSGKVEVSRDGGDGGYTMGIGRNEDGTYDNNSLRSIPKSSAEVNTGTFDVDKYKEAVDIVSSNLSDDEKTSQLTDMGFDEDSADNMLRDYENWKSRPEIIGDGNIEQGAKMANPDGQIDMKYGVYGKAAKWDVGNVHMEGGAGQMNTVFSWGTCKESGIISNCGKARIN